MVLGSLRRPIGQLSERAARLPSTINPLQPIEQVRCRGNFTHKSVGTVARDAALANESSLFVGVQS